MTTIGKYHVLEDIGSSAIGKTYRVRDVFRNRELAVKVLGPLSALNPISKEKMYADLAICSELSHRHIAKVHDLGEVDGGIYIAAELLSGKDLRKRMAGPADTIRQKLAWMAQVCEGLAIAHSKGVAHGNLKPGNLFIGAGEDITILDFGSGRWQASLLSPETKKEGLLPNYFAPEQILGQAFDARSDLFSVGLMLYELLAGKYPYQVPESLIPREIVHAQPEPLRAADPQIPEELEQLVNRALAKNPQERVQTAEEFAASLYTIAQQVRRIQASVPAETTAPAPVEAPAPPPVEAEKLLPAEPPAVEPSLIAVEAKVEIAPPEPDQARREKAAPTVDPAPQPWSARSYSANSITIPKTVAPPPKPVTLAPPHSATSSVVPAQSTANTAPVQPAMSKPAPAPFPNDSLATPPIRTPVPGRLRPAAIATKQSTLRKRALPIAIAAVLAICIIGSFVSRQNLHASQNKVAAPVPAAALPGTVAPESGREPTQASANPAPAPAASLKAPTTEPSPELILRIQVKALWEAGKYAQAMELVDGFLVGKPGSNEARAWKKKIRAAQDAEAAMK